MDTLTTEKMDPQVKAQWVAALRSPAYPQGRGALRQGDRFCCLGVLGDLAEKAGAAGRTPDHADTYWTGTGADSSDIELPVGVAAWAGLTGKHACNPLVHVDGVYPPLSEQNDDGVPFATLADIIEAQL